MSSQELPIKFEELSEEELSKMTIRRASGEKRLVRCSPGGILLPFTFVRLARNFHDFEFGSEDVVVATFPKSGTVWMGEILWAMTHFDSLATMETSAINARSYFFDLDFLHPPSSSDYSPLIAAFQEKCPGHQVDEGIMLQLAKADERRRVIKTHLQFHFFNDSLLSKSKVVYVARNPKDACVSLHYFLSQKLDTVVEGGFPATAESFMKNSMTFAPYWGHLQQAWKLRDHPNVHFVFYEDLKADIIAELGKLNEFLGLNLKEDQLKKVVEATSFENMRKRDQERPLTRMEGSFFRKGVVGDWKNLATPELDAQMDRWIEENSKDMGIKFRYS
ncbi:sulfotransferase 1E1-like [Macrobrachium nipponense]|uniref:sulfotransferase 1E1-like n=1 Tax=Macrobrachium nipponense TaxID=159736 RepID=UPI0030C825F1